MSLCLQIAAAWKWKSDSFFPDSDQFAPWTYKVFFPRALTFFQVAAAEARDLFALRTEPIQWLPKPLILPDGVKE